MSPPSARPPSARPPRSAPPSSGPGRPPGTGAGPAPLPAWIARVPARAGSGPAGAAAAFHAGAALAHLHGLAMEREDGVPMALLRDRLALGAAEAGLVRSRARARRAELRDGSCFLPAGAAMDPATARFALWRRAARMPLRGDGLARLAAEMGADAAAALAAALDGDAEGGAERGAEGCAGKGAEDGDPVARAAALLGRVRASGTRNADAASMLADAALARSLGWPFLLPLLSAGLGRHELSAEGGAEGTAGGGAEGAVLRHACRLAILREAPRIVALAADLARRAERLRAVAPKLRAKASGAAVALFLARDAVAPTMDLAPKVRGSRVPMSPRAAARLCDRLVDLGAVRELTGRATFRLYGL